MKLTKRRDLPGLFGDWQEWFEDFMSTSPVGMLQKIGITTPAVNIKEDEKAYTVEVAAPGMDKKDFNVRVDRDVLTISSETKAEKETQDDKYHRREFSYSAFSRAFTLPPTVDQDALQADYHDGVLKVTLPKVAPAPADQPQGRKVEIK